MKSSDNSHDRLHVYLAGPIRDLTIPQCTGWRTWMEKNFAGYPVHFYNPMRGKENIVEPGKVITPENFLPDYQAFYTSPAVFHRDIHLIKRSDVIFTFNNNPNPFATPGTMFEIGFGYAHHLTMIMVCENESFLRHPFVANTCITYSNIFDGADFLFKLVEDHKE